MHNNERAEMVSVRDIARWTAAFLIFLICTATFVAVTGPDLPGGSR
jgi:hypothetical protein